MLGNSVRVKIVSEARKTSRHLTGWIGNLVPVRAEMYGRPPCDTEILQKIRKNEYFTPHMHWFKNCPKFAGCGIKYSPDMFYMSK